MRLTLKDVFATAFVAIGVLAAFSVIAGWSWPLMNGVRMGVIVLGLTGMVACSVSGWGTEVAAHRIGWTDPFIVVGSVFGGAALLIGLITLFVNSAAWLALMIVAVIALWIVTVIHRLAAGLSGKPAIAA